MTGAASTADLAAIVEIEQVCFGVDAWSETLVSAELDAPARSVIVARDGSRVIGYASVVVTVDLADLLRIAVRPESRGRGYGRRLLDETMRIARNGGAERMLLEVASDNVGALALYSAAGFDAIDRRVSYYGEGRDALVLDRTLDAN